MRVGKFYFNAHHLNNVTLISKLVSKRPFSNVRTVSLLLIENIIQYLSKVSKVTLLILMKVFSGNKQV